MVGMIKDGLGLAIGIIGLMVAVGVFDMPQPPDGLSPWTVIVGCAALLAMTWRFWGAPLAMTGLAALLYAATWHHGLDLSTTKILDVIRHVETHLWLGLDMETLGWVLNVMIAEALPLFLLGSVLASRILSRGAAGVAATDTAGVGRLAKAFEMACRFFLPTLALGMIFMMQTSHMPVSMAVMAMIPPLGLAVAWFWIKPVDAGRITSLHRSTGENAILAGGTAAAFILAFAGGMSLQTSALISLGAAIALSAVDADVRSRPWLVLQALARGGTAFGRLLIAAGVIGIVLAVLARSGLPLDIAQIMAAVTGEAKLPVQLLTAIVAIGFGTFMPGLAAYLITAALLGASLRTVGVADFTAHMMILFICACASARVAVKAASEESRITSSNIGKIRRQASNDLSTERLRPDQA